MKKGGKITVPRAPGYQRSRSERQQARILAALAVAPATSLELADTLHMSRSATNKHLIALQAKPNRRVRVVDFEVVVPGRARGIYGLGAGRDIAIAEVQRKRVLKAMAEPISALDLIAKLGIMPTSAYRYIGQLMDKKKIHVVRWDWSNRTPFAVYEAGPGENVPRPTSKPVRAVTVTRRPQGIFAALGL
jgi:hypothetical protein